MCIINHQQPEGQSEGHPSHTNMCNMHIRTCTENTKTGIASELPLGVLPAPSTRWHPCNSRAPAAPPMNNTARIFNASWIPQRLWRTLSTSPLSTYPDQPRNVTSHVYNEAEKNTIWLHSDHYSLPFTQRVLLPLFTTVVTSCH